MSGFDRMMGRLQSICGVARIATTTALGGKGLRRAQVRFDADEVRDDTPLVGLYGVTSCPHPGADAVVIFPTGDRARGIIIATNDRRYQLELGEGEVALHTDEGDSVHLKRGRIVKITAGTKLEIDAPLVTVTGRVEVEGKVTVGGDVEVEGGVNAQGDVVAGTVSLTQHVHIATMPGPPASVSGPPKP